MTNETQTRRITVELDKEKLKGWKKHFRLFGTKSEFERITGRTGYGLTKMLKRGRGEESMIAAVDRYFSIINEEPNRAA